MNKLNYNPYCSGILVLLLLTITSIASFAQGPWSQGKGHGYAQLLYNTVPTYSSIFDGNGGTRSLERELSETDIILFTEIGVTNNLTFGATIPYISVRSGAPNAQLDVAPLLPADNLSSLGNISLSGRYTVLDNNWKVALISQVDIPTSSRTLDSGLSTGVDAWTFQPKISAGKGSSNGFFYGFLGYGLRSNNHNDFLNYGVEGGLKVSEKVSFIINVNRLQNINNGDPSVDSDANISTGFYTSFQEYTGYIFKLFFEDVYQGFGAFASLGGGGGANSVAASPALSLGVFRKW